MFKIKNLLISALALMAIFMAVFPALALAADPCDTDGNGTVSSKEAVQCGACGASGGSCSTGGDPTKKVNDTITTVINLLSTAIGIAAVIMIMIAGFRYTTSGGSAEKVTSAKNALMYAVIGLVIVALAQVIVRFVLKNVT